MMVAATSETAAAREIRCLGGAAISTRSLA
jgi:hypothetical protein